MNPLYPDNIWEFEEKGMDFKIKWVLPDDKSKLFWKITSNDDPGFEQYASRLEFEVPVKCDFNRLYCKGFIYIDDDKTAHFSCDNVSV